jgi:hypothetical protein
MVRNQDLEYRKAMKVHTAVNMTKDVELAKDVLKMIMEISLTEFMRKDFWSVTHTKVSETRSL